MSKKVDNYRLFLRSFGEAKVRCMKDYVKLTLPEKRDHVIVHVGTSHLNSDRESELISKSIVDLASTLKNNSVDASIFNIVVCNNKYNNRGQ